MEPQQVPAENKPATKKAIQPLNPEAVKAYVAENHPAPPPAPPKAPATTPAPAGPPASAQKPAAKDDNWEWKPNTRLSQRIPALRNYGIALVGGSLLFMYLNRTIWQFSRYRSARILGIVVYGILGAMLITGVVVLLSKSKALVELCLMLMIGFLVLTGGLSLLSGNLISLAFTVFIIVSLLNVKRYVDHVS